jgi:hypothetical protein
MFWRKSDKSKRELLTIYEKIKFQEFFLLSILEGRMFQFPKHLSKLHRTVILLVFCMVIYCPDGRTQNEEVWEKHFEEVI